MYRGPGVGFMLLRRHGLSELEIEQFKAAVPDFVSGVASMIERERTGMAQKLPEPMKTPVSLPDFTQSYEGVVEPDFFGYLGPDGPKAVKNLMLDRGVSSQTVDIHVSHNPLQLASRRITDRITLVNRNSQSPMMSFFVKVPYNEVEVRASAYAGSCWVKCDDSYRTLGPPAVAVGDCIIEEDLSASGESLRNVGSALTEFECAGFGRNIALGLIAMCKDRRFLYSSEVPSSRIFVSGEGGRISAQMVDWSMAKDISNMPEDVFNKAVYDFMHNCAFVMRGELPRWGVNTYAWSAFATTLSDPDVVKNPTLCELFKSQIAAVERDLVNPEHRIAGVPVGDDAARWKSFFDVSRRSVPFLMERVKGAVSRVIGAGGTLLEAVKRTLKIDLQRSDILAPEVAEALVKDLIERVKVYRYMGLGVDEFKQITAGALGKLGIPEDKIAGVTKNLESELQDKSVLAFNDMSLFLDSSFKKCGVAVPGFMDLFEVEMSKRMSFTAVPGDISWNRPWATHILVRGPEPSRNVIVVYRFKPMHHLAELEASEIASVEGTGPRIIWSSEKEQLMLEEFVPPVGEPLEKEDTIILSVNTAAALCRMFDLKRAPAFGKSIHKFDGFERGHFIVRRDGTSLKPCFVDYGVQHYLTPENRVELMAGHLSTLVDTVRFWRHGVLAWAYIEKELEHYALRRGGDYGRDIRDALCKNRLSMTDTSGFAQKFLAERYASFLSEVDKVKESLPAE